MPQNSSRSAESSMIDHIRNFLQLISNDRWDEALYTINQPNDEGISWTREFIIEVVNKTFPPSSRFRVQHPGPITFTDPNLLSSPPVNMITICDIPDGFEVCYPVPLSGEWSDLIAIFEFHRTLDSKYKVVIHDFHVL